jgi:hypothetical protein
VENNIDGRWGVGALEQKTKNQRQRRTIMQPETKKAYIPVINDTIEMLIIRIGEANDIIQEMSTFLLGSQLQVDEPDKKAVDTEGCLPRMAYLLNQCDKKVNCMVSDLSRIRNEGLTDKIPVTNTHDVRKLKDEIAQLSTDNFEEENQGSREHIRE